MVSSLVLVHTGKRILSLSLTLPLLEVGEAIDISFVAAQGVEDLPPLIKCVVKHRTHSIVSEGSKSFYQQRLTVALASQENLVTLEA